MLQRGSQIAAFLLVMLTIGVPGVVRAEPPGVDAQIQVRLENGETIICRPARNGENLYVPVGELANQGLLGWRSWTSWEVGLFLFGFIGQIMFFGRWIVQWWVSERSGRSVMPILFWWLSLSGATVLLVYFSLRAEPIGILGQAVGWTVYSRNLLLVARERRSGAPAPVNVTHPPADPNAEP